MHDALREQAKRLELLFSGTDAVYHEATLKLGLTDSSVIVLYTICLFDGSCPLGDITALSGLPKQTVNSALRRLEGGGILYLEPAGGRKKRVCLTEKGRELFRFTLPSVFVGYDRELFELTAGAFLIYSFSFLFCGVAIFGLAFFTALNDGLTSALISFLRTLVFQVAAAVTLAFLLGKRLFLEAERARVPGHIEPSRMMCRVYRNMLAE